MTSSVQPTAYHADFSTRHIGASSSDILEMLNSLGLSSMQELLDEVIPTEIKRQSEMHLSEGMSEAEILEDLAVLAAQNKPYISLIGMGYYGTYMPAVIKRNVFENPAWYTAYTPYQPEISQGRLEAILNFQTMVMELTAMEIANASLLDEATAAAEAMQMAHCLHKGGRNIFRVDADTHPQTLAVLRTRAEPLGIEIDVAPSGQAYTQESFAALISYPSSTGQIRDIETEISDMKAAGNIAIVISDLLALTLLKPPGECGADIVCGSAQRFGVPLGFGGPHAAFFATRTAYQRMLPGRLVGVSKDSAGRIGYRLALQTREQHIRREKATSNICTVQVLLAVIAGFYSVWHGPEGLKHIALHAHQMACLFARSMQKAGYKIRHADFFDTVVIEAPEKAEELVFRAAEQGINLRKLDNGFSLSFDETTQPTIVEKLLSLYDVTPVSPAVSIADKFCRKSAFMQQQIFSRYHTETEMMRYMRTLADRDLALDRCMIPLGSCTMKLNAAAEMIPVSWPAFADIHPFAPADQTQGYLTMIARLEKQLQECTGYAAISLQPNSGAQGEFAGLLAIRRYHQSNGQAHRNICLIPESAHGTNPASAHMAGMNVVVVKCDAGGNIDLSDLKAKLEKYGPEVAASMLTYPSTHGVFEEGIT